MFVLSVGACLSMGILSIAFSDDSVDDALQNGMAAQQVPFKIPEKSGIVAKEKKDQAWPVEQKKLTPSHGEPKGVSRAKAIPPKKYVPLEKIRADQTVDFPADI